MLAVTLLALQPRPLVTSIGAVHGWIVSDTGMSAWLAGAVVAAPVWCFAAGGLLSSTLRGRCGTTRSVAGALVVLTAALSVRVVGGGWVLLAGTILACLAAALIAGLTPVVIKAIPDPRRRSRLNAGWGAAMGCGSAAGALVTPQLAEWSSWRWAAASWALLAIAALVVWLSATRGIHDHLTGPADPAHGQRAQVAERATGRSSVSSVTAWTLTVHFGMVCGFSFLMMGQLVVILSDIAAVPASRAQHLNALAMTIGVPVALFAVPTLIQRSTRHRAGQSWLVLVLSAPSMAATIGLLVWPTLAPWAWAVAIGVGTPSVVLAMAMIGIRTTSASADTTAGLSALAQGGGYLIAGITITVVLAVHAGTGSWQAPLIMQAAVLAVQMITGWRAGRPTGTTSPNAEASTQRGVDSAKPAPPIHHPRAMCQRPSLRPHQRTRRAPQPDQEGHDGS